MAGAEDPFYVELWKSGRAETGDDAYLGCAFVAGDVPTEIRSGFGAGLHEDGKVYRSWFRECEVESVAREWAVRFPDQPMDAIVKRVLADGSATTWAVAEARDWNGAALR